MAISSPRAAVGFAPPSSAGRSNTAPTKPGTSKPSTILTSSLPISSIWQRNLAADCLKKPGGTKDGGGERSEPSRICLQGPDRDPDAEPAAAAQCLQRRVGAEFGGCAAALRPRPAGAGCGHLRQRPRLFQRRRCPPASAAQA